MSAIDELIEFMRSFESDHLPDGWPAVRMQQITMLLDEIEALRQERDGLLRAAKYLSDFNHPDPDEEWLNSAAIIDAAMAKEQGDE